MMTTIAMRALGVVAAGMLLASCEPKAVPDNTVAAARDSAGGMPAQVTDADHAIGEAVVFPENFRGNWDYREDGCQKDESGTRFEITEHQIKGYEETATLKSVEIVDDLTIRVVVDAQSSDGDAIVTQTLKLSPVAGITLRIDTGGKTVRAVRCDPV